jgi:hypothetical protein
MAETIAWGKCEGADCGGSVAVKVNRSGMAYYRCDHCGRKVEHSWKRASDRYVAAVGVPLQIPADIGQAKPVAKPAAVPAPAPAPRKPIRADSMLTLLDAGS